MFLKRYPLKTWPLITCSSFCCSKRVHCSQRAVSSSSARPLSPPLSLSSSAPAWTLSLSPSLESLSGRLPLLVLSCKVSWDTTSLVKPSEICEGLREDLLHFLGIYFSTAILGNKHDKNIYPTETHLVVQFECPVKFLLN